MKKQALSLLTLLGAAATMLTCEKAHDYCSRWNRYDPEYQFCFAGKAYSLCAGRSYNPLTQGCAGAGDAPGTRCADSTFVESGTPCNGYTLSTATAPADGGKIIRVPDKANYKAGEQVALSAVEPKNEYVFAGWAGAETTENATVTLTMNSNKPMVAMFNPVSAPGATAHALVTTAFPANGGTINRNPDAATYNTGTAVAVTAVAAQGYTFAGWSGASSSASTTTTVTMDAGKTLVAMFTPIVYTLTVNANPSTGGTVFVNNTALTGATQHDAGTPIRVVAQAAVGYVFTGWTGAETLTEKEMTFAMDGNKTLTANFQKTTGTFTDPRDGQSYRTVRIGNRTWMAENLNYVAYDSWCYDNDPSNCAKYGRLYDWNAAMSACPAEWRLPTRADWDDLVQAVGSSAGAKLKSKTGWNSGGNGADNFGFSALPGGYRYAGGAFDNAGYYGRWWNATEYESYAWYRFMYYNNGSVNEDLNDKGNGFSVRCCRAQDNAER